MLREAARQEPVPQSHWCVNTILTFADEPQWFLDIHIPKPLLHEEDALKRAFQQWCARLASTSSKCPCAFTSTTSTGATRTLRCVRCVRMQSSGKLFFGDFE